MINLDEKEILTFDCYGTLIDWETGIKRSISSMFVNQKLQDSEILHLFAETEHRVQTEYPKMSYENVLKEVITRIGKKLSQDKSEEEEKSFSQGVKNWLPFDDTVGALKRLSKKFKLVIISNIDKSTIEVTKKHLVVDFYQTYTAEEIGAYKPDHKVFKYVFDKFEKYGYGVNQVLHVAESLYHDHVPAKNMGFDSVWINRRINKTGPGASPNVGDRWIPEKQFPDLISFANWALDLS